MTDLERELRRLAEKQEDACRSIAQPGALVGVKARGYDYDKAAAKSVAYTHAADLVAAYFAKEKQNAG